MNAKRRSRVVLAHGCSPDEKGSVELLLEKAIGFPVVLRSVSGMEDRNFGGLTKESGSANHGAFQAGDRLVLIFVDFSDSELKEILGAIARSGFKDRPTVCCEPTEENVKLQLRAVLAGLVPSDSTTADWPSDEWKDWNTM